MECDGGVYRLVTAHERKLSANSAQSAGRALVIRGIKVIMRPLTGFARGPSLPPPVDPPVTAVVIGTVLPESPEASRVMSETEQRQGPSPRPLTPAEAGGFDDDEPPGKPRRHPLWQDVPDHQWDDWRWQSQNAIRSVRQLRDLLPFTPGGAGSHRRPRRRVQARHPAVLLLAHRPRRPERPDPAAVGDHRRWKPRTRRATSWKTRSKRTRTRRSPG